MVYNDPDGAIHSNARLDGDVRSDVRLPRDRVGSKHRLVRVAPGEIAHAWAILEPFLIEAASGSRGRYSVESIIGQVFREDWQLWGVINDDVLQALLGTEMSVELSGNRSAAVVFAVGERPREWVHLIDELESWARSQGCSRMEVWARKGWAKFLDAYKLTHVMLERRL